VLKVAELAAWVALGLPLQLREAKLDYRPYNGAPMIFGVPPWFGQR